MRKNPISQFGIFNPRVLLASALCSVGVFLAMLSVAAPTPPSAMTSSALRSSSDALNKHAGHSAAVPLAPAASGQWNIVSSPNTSSTQYNFLNGVTCASATDCWAVGWYYNDGNAVKTLIEHYDGSSWAIVSAPTPSSIIGNATQDLLVSVTCVSENNCWAVGYFTDGVTVHTLAEHNTGSGWAVVSSPDAVSRDSRLESVTCVNASDCWAVGVYSTVTNGRLQTLVEHYDGMAWSIASSPNPLPLGDVLLGVSCLSASDCWAAGWGYNAQGDSQPLFQHYDGTAWSIVGIPNIGYSLLRGITCASATDCWAVGSYYPSGPAQTLAEHYDGTAWSIVTSPNDANGQNNALYSVTCVNASDCWAVGVHYSDTSNYRTGEGNPLTLVEHYDGAAWSIVSSPNTSVTNYNVLAGVSCVNASNCWAVGYYADSSSYHTLIEHYTVPVPVNGVVSRKTHGNAGTFDINLPLTGNPGIECRSGTNGDYKLVFTFENPLSSVDSASVSSGTGTVNSSAIGADPHEYIVNLTGVTNQQRLTITLTSVQDTAGNLSPSVAATMAVLLGDTTGNGTVNSSDIGQAKSNSGQTATASNFRADVTVNGVINSSDIGTIKAQSGTSLP